MARDPADPLLLAEQPSSASSSSRRLSTARLATVPRDPSACRLTAHPKTESPARIVELHDATAGRPRAVDTIEARCATGAEARGSRRARTRPGRGRLSRFHDRDRERRRDRSRDAPPQRRAGPACPMSPSVTTYAVRLWRQPATSATSTGHGARQIPGSASSGVVISGGLRWACWEPIVVPDFRNSASPARRRHQLPAACA
jgi:hypothetical protein